MPDIENTLENDAVIRHLMDWANGRSTVRAVLLTSSRISPYAPKDVFSDYDVILAVTDVQPFFESRAWLDDFGPMLVVYRDPLQRFYDMETFAYITQYENGLKIDFSLWPVEILARVAADPVLPPDLDVGYAILLDKDSLTAGLKPPTYKAFIPAPPDKVTYQTVIEVFFHEATYVAKHLWRGDLMAAKYNLDYAMKHKKLRLMLEWYFEIDCGWSVKPGAYGRGIQNRLNPEIWAELKKTYVGSDPEENWDAMFRTIELFKKVAIAVADHLGYQYPDDLHRRAVAYFRNVKNLERGATSFPW